MTPNRKGLAMTEPSEDNPQFGEQDVEDEQAVNLDLPRYVPPVQRHAEDEPSGPDVA